MNRKLINNTAWYFGGTLASAMLGFLSSPILTRVLSPKVYAQYGMITAFTTLVATFIYMGQDEAFMRFFSNRNISYWKFLWKCIKLPLCLCLFISCILLEPTHYLLRWIFDTDISLSVAVFISIYIIFIVFQRFVMLTARMEERAENYSISNIVTKVFFFIPLFLIYFFMEDIELLELIISLIIGVMIAFFINISVLSGVEHRTLYTQHVVSTKELFTFGLPLALSTTLFWLVPMLEKIVIRDLTNWNVLAIYMAAAIFVTAMNLLQTTINNIWLPYVYKNYQYILRFQRAFHYIGISLCCLCLCILAGTVFFRRWLVLIFDQRYYDCRLIAPALVCGSCFDILSSIYSVGINIKKKTIFRVIIPVIQLIVSLSILYIGLPKYGLVVTGISYLLSIAISRIIQIVIALHYYGTGYGYKKIIVMMMSFIVIGILSCFYDSLQFDVLCGCFLVILAFAISYKELFVVSKWLFFSKG